MREPFRHENEQEDFREAYLADDFFEETSPVREVTMFAPEVPKVLPKWLRETRIVCALVGICGLVATIFNLDFFFWQIRSPILLNLTLLTVLMGFLNCIVYPYALTYSLINGIKKVNFLRGLNSMVLGFMIVLVLFLFSFPVSGLGLALILVPAPLLFAWYSRKYLQSESHFMEENGTHYPFGAIFNHDLRRAAWFTFLILFSGLVFVFFGLAFGLL